MRVNPEIQMLDRESHRIVGLICSESVAEAEIDRRIDDLRRRTERAFPDRPELFDETFGRRFQRLRTQFRPNPVLFESQGATQATERSSRSDDG